MNEESPRGVSKAQWGGVLMIALLTAGGVLAVPRDAAACFWNSGNCCSIIGGTGGPVCCGDNQCDCDCGTQQCFCAG